MTIIFDMDGVLGDSEVYWAQSRCEFAEACNPQWHSTFQREMMGESSIGWARMIQSRLSATPATSLGEVLALTDAHIVIIENFTPNLITQLETPQ